MSDDLHLAQVNVARMTYAKNGPEMADFMGALANINAVADRAPGFVWRLQDDGGDATSITFGDRDDLLVNMSTWTEIEPLRRYVYQTAHAAVMARRAKWFPPFGTAHMALWWTPANRRPTVADAAERLARLDAQGPSPFAFTFDRAFDRAGAPMQLPSILKDCA